MKYLLLVLAAFCIWSCVAQDFKLDLRPGGVPLRDIQEGGRFIHNMGIADVSFAFDCKSSLTKVWKFLLRSQDWSICSCPGKDWGEFINGRLILCKAGDRKEICQDPENSRGQFFMALGACGAIKPPNARLIVEDDPKPLQDALQRHKANKAKKQKPKPSGKTPKKL